jgi:general secretion pathway protein C
LLLTKNLPYDAESSPSHLARRAIVMDVAKRLADWTDQPPEAWFTSINRYLPPIVIAVLVIAIAYQLATLTWTLAPGSTPTFAPAPRAASNGNEPVADLTVLNDSNLFGQEAEQTAPVVAEVIDAPETTLSLTLKGILAREDDTSGRAVPGAIISSSRGEDRAYQVGQTVADADGATLHSVYADRVLLNRSGRLETLRLPKELTASAAPMGMPSPLPQAAQPQGSLREVITENATRLTDIVRIAPHVQEGQVVGFRVTPGRDRATFEALGLQSGDVVTDINGTVLDDPSQGLQVFQSLGESTQANVTVLRDGVPQVVVIDTTQLQSLQENRE